MFFDAWCSERTSAVVVGGLRVVSAYLVDSSKPFHDFELSVEELRSCLSRLRGRTRYTVIGMGANAEPDATWGPKVVGNAATRRPTIGFMIVQHRGLLRQVLLDFGLFVFNTAGPPLGKACPSSAMGTADLSPT